MPVFKQAIGVKMISVALALAFTSCVSRLSRPALLGVVVDENKLPIAGCKVGETLTAADGTFYLQEIRYHKFFIPEAFMMEAPPVMVMEYIEKPGYQKDSIDFFQTFGGGQKKGATMNLDTIVLKKL